MTKAQADAILDELIQIRRLLERQASGVGTPSSSSQAPTQISVSVVPAPYALGRPDAPVTIVEFTDYQCPFCRQFHTETFPQIKTELIDTGTLRYISLDLPLPMHDHAVKAAEAARCAGDQGRFWEMRSALISDTSELTDPAIVKLAAPLVPNLGLFQTCFLEDRHRADIQRDVAVANALQIDATPTFIVGKAVNGRLVGTEILGARPYSVFKRTIEEFLSTAGH